MSSKKGYFKIHKSTAKQPYRWNLHARNHEIILRSENYTTKQNALNGIESVRRNAPIDDNYDRLTAKDGSFYFNLKAENSQVIGTSEMYTTKAAREVGIEAVKREAPDATIVDTTESDDSKDEAKTVGAVASTGGFSVLSGAGNDKSGIPYRPKGGFYGTL